ncbi:YtzH-like family protein [Thalassobacillus hwangdonensis]|uniref:YtzH-like family protein n=1 Tax=Thalassobacillus hwangdonensis TaxID=546108 RepID=A0ABW3L163_9BACI
MSLTVNDQLNMLYDLLTEQCEDGCGTVSECQQIARIVHSLQSKQMDSRHETLTGHLPNIYDYGNNVQSTQQLDDHIRSNQPNLHEWISVLEQIKDQ